MRPERAERERPLPEQYAPNVKIGNNAKPRLLKIKPLGRVMKGEKKVSSMSCLNTNGGSAFESDRVCVVGFWVAGF